MQKTLSERQIHTQLTAVKPETSNSHNILHSSKSCEWYTPARYIAAVYEVMGGVDVDPASCELANQTIQARQYFTIDDDGLTQEWRGRVFLNPPYGKTNGKSNQAVWSSALIERYRRGEVTEAILLVNATPGDKWFTPLWDYQICFTDHRIKFYNAAGESSQPTHSNCFVYLGANCERFTSVFSQFGVVACKL